MKKVIIAITCFLAILFIILYLYRGVIFQRGNPIPYISKMFTLSDSNQYSRVFDNDDVFITNTNNYDDLIQYIEKHYDVVFVEQMGSAYMFSTDSSSMITNLIASTEIYWRRYIVWEIQILNN